MKSIFAKWLEIYSRDEKKLNLLAKKIIGQDAPPIQAHGWVYTDPEIDSKIYMIGHMNKRSSNKAMTGNVSFMAACRALMEMAGSRDAQPEIRSIVYLHEFRKFGFHELNLNIDQAIGLINTDVNLDVDEFTSMFPLMVVNFPDELRQVYLEKNQFFPSIAFIRHEPQQGMLLIEFVHHFQDWNNVSSGCISFFSKKNNNMFDTIQEKLNWDETKSVMRPESIDAAKLAINSILLAQRTNNMVRIDKNQNDPIQQQFKRTMRGTGNLGKITEATFWSFQPNLKTFNSQQESRSGEEKGKIVRPHWRRGHWRRVAHGEKRIERKWMHFPAVFVNAERFEGKMNQTFTSHNLNC